MRPMRPQDASKAPGRSADTGIPLKSPQKPFYGAPRHTLKESAMSLMTWTLVLLAVVCVLSGLKLLIDRV